MLPWTRIGALEGVTVPLLRMVIPELCQTHGTYSASATSTWFSPAAAENPSSKTAKSANSCFLSKAIGYFTVRKGLYFYKQV
jgi:hypothetical protein